MKRIDAIFAALLGILGIYVVWKGIDYGYQRDDAPGSGLFPILIGTGIVALSVVNVFRAALGLEHLENRFDWASIAKTVGMIAAMGAYLLLVGTTGMVLGSIGLVLALGFIINPGLEKGFVARLVAVSIGFPIAGFLIFSVGLGVRLVEGPLGF